MNNSIQSIYITWLRNYFSKSKDRNAKPLIDGLSKITSFDELVYYFSQNTASEKAKYRSKIINVKLSEWKSELEAIEASLLASRTVLANLSAQPKCEELRTLLGEILYDQRLLLHYRLPSLLHAMNHSQLPDIVQYIISLPEAPTMMRATGTFGAGAPKSQEHAVCLELLHNLAYSDNQSTDFWNISNQLLQSSLQIYCESDLVEIELSDEPSEKTENEENKDNNRCTIM